MGGRFYLLCTFVSRLLVYHIWYPCTSVWDCNGITAFGLNVLSSGKDTDTFILTTICLCLTNQTNSTAVLLTTVSERPPTKRVAIHPLPLLGILDLSAYGIDLHGCTIRYLRKPNVKGNIITGIFSISGRIETAGATSYESLILFLVDKRKEYHRYVSECRQLKRQRNYESWLARHPEFIFHNCNVTFVG